MAHIVVHHRIFKFQSHLFIARVSYEFASHSYKIGVTVKFPFNKEMASKRTASGTVKTRGYTSDYLKFGFIESQVNKSKPECIFCGDVLSNDSMKPSKLKRHQESKHPSTLTQDLAYFEVGEKIIS